MSGFRMLTSNGDYLTIKSKANGEGWILDVDPLEYATRCQIRFDVEDVETLSQILKSLVPRPRKRIHPGHRMWLQVLPGYGRKSILSCLFCFRATHKSPENRGLLEPCDMGAWLSERDLRSRMKKLDAEHL